MEVHIIHIEKTFDKHLKEVIKLIHEDNKYILSRSELKARAASEFNHNDIVICGKYYIHICYRRHDSDEKNMPVSFFTEVNTRDDLRSLPVSKQPLYIRDFINCYANLQ